MPDMIEGSQTTLEMAWLSVLSETIAWLPRLLGCLLLVGTGWLLSDLVARMTGRLLDAIRLDEWMTRSGLERAIARSSMRLEPRDVLSGLIRWAMFLVSIVASAEILGAPEVARTLNDVVRILPNGAAAILMVILGMAMAEAAGKALQRKVGPGYAFLSPLAVRGMVILAVLAALSQVHLVPVLLQSLMLVVLGAAGLAGAIACGTGLGGSVESLVQGQILRQSCEVGDILTWTTREGEKKDGRIESIDPLTLSIRTANGTVILPHRMLAGQVFEVRASPARAQSATGSAASASTSEAASDFLLSRSVTTDVARELESS